MYDHITVMLPKWWNLVLLMTVTNAERLPRGIYAFKYDERVTQEENWRLSCTREVGGLVCWWVGVLMVWLVDLFLLVF